MPDDPTPPATDFLDQSEIDKLLAQTVEQTTRSPTRPAIGATMRL